MKHKNARRPGITLLLAAALLTFPVGAEAASPGCGNGLVESPELCDDGNRIGGDGCDEVCGQEKDVDDDGLSDAWEEYYTSGLSVLTGPTADPDSDGLNNEDEHSFGTNPASADSDGDGLTDGDELDVFKTDPRFADTDGDGMPDGWECENHLDPLTADSGKDSDQDKLAALGEYLAGTDPNNADTDGDGMPDGWEVDFGLDPTAADAHDDADGDRYPNIFEYARGSNPVSSSSLPKADIVVDLQGNGHVDNIGAALESVDPGKGEYQIIAIAAGYYAGASNCNNLIPDGSPHLLVIGAGAAATVVDCSGFVNSWRLETATTLASMTIRGTNGPAIYVDVQTPPFMLLPITLPGLEVHFNDLVVVDNAGLTEAGGVHQVSFTPMTIYGSTFLNNTGAGWAEQIQYGGILTIVNTVAWSDSGLQAVFPVAQVPTVLNETSSRLQSVYQVVSDPGLRADGRLSDASPLIGVGAASGGSLLDMDLEARPQQAPDIGADQWIDSDNDSLPDAWEIATAGNLTLLTGIGGDADVDGLDDLYEYLSLLDPVNVDTDGDGASDGHEVSVAGTDPLRADTDGDDMPDGWEIAYGLDPLSHGGFDDTDGDRFPDVFEFAEGTDPVAAADYPVPDYVVDGPGGAGYPDLLSAMTAAVSGPQFRVVGLAPGVYSGDRNCGVVLGSTTPKMMLLGAGAANTVLDCAGLFNAITIQTSAIVTSLSIKNTNDTAVLVSGPGDVRLVDVLMTGNVSQNGPGAIDVASDSNLRIFGSTLIGNVGMQRRQIRLAGAAALHLVNSVVWAAGTEPIQTLILDPYSGAVIGQSSIQLGVNTPSVYSPVGAVGALNSLVDGWVSSGFFATLVDPLLRFDGRILPGSPLRSAGIRGELPVLPPPILTFGEQTVPFTSHSMQSQYDLDLEFRPDVQPDVGVDQWVDDDNDGLPDAWEQSIAGGLTTLTGAGDADGDGLSDGAEYLHGRTAECDPLNPDSDGDLMPDGSEVQYGTDPTSYDHDEFVFDANHDGLVEAIGLQLGYSPLSFDTDGDGLSNEDELVRGTDPTRVDTDGDGVPDGSDPFPLDPWMATLSSSPADVTAPVITLVTPASAVAL